MESNKITKRERAETAMLEKFRCLRVFKPGKDWRALEPLKDGSFGFGSAAFALYSNGFNARGKSAIAPFGLLYENDGAVFSVGYFRKEGSGREEDGYLFVVAPKGKGAVEAAAEFAAKALEDRSIPCKGVYVRFLDGSGLAALERKGFVKVDERHYPWHDEAPLEDETHCHSEIKLADALDLAALGKNGFAPEAVGRARGDHRNKSRRAVGNFASFLGKNGLEYRLEKMPHQMIARGIAGAHFEYVWKSGKAVGSTAQDYFGVLSGEVASLPQVFARAGYLRDLPVSAFVAESLGKAVVGIYSMLTIRDEKYLAERMVGLDMAGFGSIARYALLRFFAELAWQGVKAVKLGGSETHGLDRFKWELGAEEDRTFWASLGQG
jgi:hypothetical protein